MDQINASLPSSFVSSSSIDAPLASCSSAYSCASSGAGNAAIPSTAQIIEYLGGSPYRLNKENPFAAQFKEAISSFASDLESDNNSANHDVLSYCTATLDNGAVTDVTVHAAYTGDSPNGPMFSTASVDCSSPLQANFPLSEFLFPPSSSSPSFSPTENLVSAQQLTVSASSSILNSLQTPDVSAMLAKQSQASLFTTCGNSGSSLIFDPKPLANPVPVELSFPSSREIISVESSSSCSKAQVPKSLASHQPKRPPTLLSSPDFPLFSECSPPPSGQEDASSPTVLSLSVQVGNESVKIPVKISIAKSSATPGVAGPSVTPSTPKTPGRFSVSVASSSSAATLRPLLPSAPSFVYPRPSGAAAAFADCITATHRDGRIVFSSSIAKSVATSCERTHSGEDERLSRTKQKNKDSAFKYRQRKKMEYEELFKLAVDERKQRDKLQAKLDVLKRAFEPLYSLLQDHAHCDEFTDEQKASIPPGDFPSFIDALNRLASEEPCPSVRDIKEDLSEISDHSQLRKKFKQMKQPQQLLPRKPECPQQFPGGSSRQSAGSLTSPPLTAAPKAFLVPVESLPGSRPNPLLSSPTTVNFGTLLTGGVNARQIQTITAATNVGASNGTNSQIIVIPFSQANTAPMQQVLLAMPVGAFTPASISGK